MNKVTLILSSLMLLCYPSLYLKNNNGGQMPPEEIKEAGTYFVEINSGDDSKGIQKVALHVKFPKTILNYEVH